MFFNEVWVTTSFLGSARHFPASLPYCIGCICLLVLTPFWKGLDQILPVGNIFSDIRAKMHRQWLIKKSVSVWENFSFKTSSPVQTIIIRISSDTYLQVFQWPLRVLVCVCVWWTYISWNCQFRCLLPLRLTLSQHGFYAHVYR